MKVIGTIKAEIGEDGELTNKDYVGGSIVMLTEREAQALKELQIAWDNGPFRFPLGMIELADGGMDGAFLAARVFTEAKFAINNFRETINELDDILIKGGENEL